GAARRLVLPLLLFTETSTTRIYTLSLHDALPILAGRRGSGRHHGRDVHEAGEVAAHDLAQQLVGQVAQLVDEAPRLRQTFGVRVDRKSTRLNSSHVKISYAVFCLKKKRQWSAATQ